MATGNWLGHIEDNKPCKKITLSQPERSRKKENKKRKHGG
jgi:hypothetical protein